MYQLAGLVVKIEKVLAVDKQPPLALIQDQWLTYTFPLFLVPICTSLTATYVIHVMDQKALLNLGSIYYFYTCKAIDGCVYIEQLQPLPEYDQSNCISIYSIVQCARQVPFHKLSILFDISSMHGVKNIELCPYMEVFLLLCPKLRILVPINLNLTILHYIHNTDLQ